MLRKDLVKELNNQNLQLARQIRLENNIRGSSEEAYSFMVTGLKLLYPGINYNQLKDCITDDYNDGGFDAFLFNVKRRTISIFDFKNEPGYSYNDILLFRNNIEDYLLNSTQVSAVLTRNILGKVRRVRRLINAYRYGIEVYIVRNGVSSPNARTKDLFNDLAITFSKIKRCDFLNADSLFDKMLEIEPGENDFVWKPRIISDRNLGRSSNKIITSRSSGNRRRCIDSLVTKVKVKDIIKLQKEFIRKELDLFDANVRTSQRNKNLSTGIINTIEKSPGLFYIFHNGLTFSCSNIDMNRGNQCEITNPQVINGCQTVATLYDKYKNESNNPKLRKATVFCRFYRLDSSMVEKVCETTNTQLKINPWDLRANDAIQKIIDKALGAKGFNYIRKKGSRKKNTVSLTDLGQWIYSSIQNKPAEAKNKKSKLFNISLPMSSYKSPYEKIFNENIRLKEIYIICEIAFFVRNKIKNISRNRLSFEKVADLHFIAALFRLRDKSWSLGYKFRKVNRIIKDVIIEMRRRHGRDFDYNKIFTKEKETWKLIRKALIKI